MFKKKRVYLDQAAGVSGNPSSPHAEGRAAHEELEGARTAIARLVECKSDDVLFTSGATEANALAILGTLRAARAAGLERPHALYFEGSHASIVENMKQAEREGTLIEPLPIKDCQVACDKLAKMLRPETVLISLEAVDGETGIVWNTREVANLLARSRSRFFAPSGPTADGGQPVAEKSAPAASSAPGVFLHVDASQAVWTEKLTRAHFGAGLMTLDASKVCEARGIGCLIAPRKIPLAPLYAGGGQERGLVPGSEAPALASAFAEGLAQAALGRRAFCERASGLREGLIACIREEVRDLYINESPRSEGEQAPHIINISLPGRDTDYLVALLDEAGYALSTKSACESLTGEGSRAVLALWGDPGRAAATLRVSFGPAVRKGDLDRFAQTLIHAVRFVDSTGGA